MKKLLLIFLTIMILVFGVVTAYGAEIIPQDDKDLDTVDTLEVTNEPLEEDELDAEVSHAPETSSEPDASYTTEVISQDGEFAAAADLYQSWMFNHVDYEKSPYPSYICGVYSTDGTENSLTFAVTKDEAGEAGKEEILALVSDHSTVTFTYQSYPYADLWAVQLELTPYLGDETGANSLGIHEMENVLMIGIDESNEGAGAFMQSSIEKYGDMIEFEKNEGVFPREEGAFEDADLDIGGDIVAALDITEPVKSKLNIWYAFIPFVLLLSIGLFLFLRHRHVSRMQTNTGEIVSAEKISTHQVEEMVKKSEVTPSTELDKEILTKIDKM